MKYILLIMFISFGVDKIYSQDNKVFDSRDSKNLGEIVFKSNFVLYNSENENQYGIFVDGEFLKFERVGGSIGDYYKYRISPIKGEKGLSNVQQNSEYIRNQYGWLRVNKTEFDQSYFRVYNTSQTYNRTEVNGKLQSQNKERRKLEKELKSLISNSLNSLNLNEEIISEIENSISQNLYDRLYSNFEKLLNTEKEKIFYEMLNNDKFLRDLKVQLEEIE